MNKFALCSFVALLIHSLAFSQSITEYRYWWDDDVSTLVTEAVSTGQTFSLDTEIATAADLGVGHHTITFQVKDENDEWSVPIARKFYQNGELVQYEYWFDDDITSSNIESVPSTDNLQVTSLDVSSLDAGIHSVTIRTITSNGGSSIPVSRNFRVSGGDLVSWEYWFDDDVTTIIQESVSPPNTTLELIENLDASDLGEGPHTVTWRCEDVTSTWSVPITYSFDVILSVEDIPGLNSVLIFPSPTRGDLNIKIDSDSYLDLNVEILNQQGQVIKAQRNALTTVLSLDVSELAAGIYFLRLSDSDHFVTYKFVKQ